MHLERTSEAGRPGEATSGVRETTGRVVVVAAMLEASRLSETLLDASGLGEGSSAVSMAVVTMLVVAARGSSEAA